MLKPAIRFLWRNLPFKLPVLRPIRSIETPPHRLYQHLHFAGDFEVEIEPGASFLIRSYGNYVENDLFWAGYHGNFERVSLHLWGELARDAETVLDVGANTGVFALSAAAINPDARVTAFEPVPRVVEKLRANVALNGGRIAVESVAVSDREGTARLCDTDSAHVYSASLGQAMLGDEYTRSYDVPTVSLDDFCAANEIERVDLVKIDVERHEPSVIRGFRKMISAHRPTLVVEILDAGILSAVMAELDGVDYEVFDLANLGSVPGIPAPVPGHAERNYLFCTADVAERLGLVSGAGRA